jgi:hypothetical protein
MNSCAFIRKEASICTRADGAQKIDGWRTRRWYSIVAKPRLQKERRTHLHVREKQQNLRPIINIQEASLRSWRVYRQCWQRSDANIDGGASPRSQEGVANIQGVPRKDLVNQESPVGESKTNQKCHRTKYCCLRRSVPPLTPPAQQLPLWPARQTSHRPAAQDQIRRNIHPTRININPTRVNIHPTRVKIHHTRVNPTSPRWKGMCPHANI